MLLIISASNIIVIVVAITFTNVLLKYFLSMKLFFHYLLYFGSF